VEIMTDLQTRIAGLIGNSIEYDEEGGEGGFYYIPFKTFMVDICALLKEFDSQFDEVEFMASIGYKKVNQWLIVPTSTI